MPDTIQQTIEIGPHRRRNTQRGTAAGTLQVADQLRPLIVRDQFLLVQHQDAGSLEEPMAISIKLVLHHPEISDRIVCSGINQMNQQSGALDVAQEVVAEPGSLGGTRDESWDVSEDGSVTAGSAHDPEVGDQGCERVVGDFGAGG